MITILRLEDKIIVYPWSQIENSIIISQLTIFCIFSSIFNEYLVNRLTAKRCEYRIVKLVFGSSDENTFYMVKC